MARRTCSDFEAQALQLAKEAGFVQDLPQIRKMRP
jgi:hypothetical protein